MILSLLAFSQPTECASPPLWQSLPCTHKHLPHIHSHSLHQCGTVFTSVQPCLPPCLPPTHCHQLHWAAAQAGPQWLDLLEGSCGTAQVPHPAAAAAVAAASLWDLRPQTAAPQPLELGDQFLWGSCSLRHALAIASCRDQAGHTDPPASLQAITSCRPRHTDPHASWHGLPLLAVC